MLDADGLVERDINKRWEHGEPHHKDSAKLFKAVSIVDMRYGDNYFDWRSGGDGDNGEMLMYELDIFFECIDNGESFSSI